MPTKHRVFDLHSHTRVSDGSYSPEELIVLAKERGVTHLAITDHDYVDHLNDCLELGSQLGVKIIPGVEISAYDFDRKRKVHVLGYGFDLTAHHIRSVCQPMVAARDANTRNKILGLAQMGISITLDEVEALGGQSSALYKQHVMQVLVDKGLADGLYGETYQKLFKQGPLSGDISYVSAQEAVEAIHADGGIAVVAHPGQLDSWELVEELAALGLDGVEAHHPSHGAEDVERALGLAKKLGLLVTGGSDFHGSYGSEPLPGTFCAPGYDGGIVASVWGASLSLARQILIDCGETLREIPRGRGAEPYKVHYKERDHRDLVTEYDHKVNDRIVTAFSKRFPHYGLISEETPESYRDSRHPVLIVDPIDGTTNFHRLGKDYAISVALWWDGQPLWGLLYDVAGGTLYLALRENLTSETLCWSQRDFMVFPQGLTDLREALVDTSLGSLVWLNRRHGEKNPGHEFLPHFNKAITGHRSSGCSSLGILRIALGEIQVYFSSKLVIWDWAASVQFLKASGGGWDVGLNGLQELEIQKAPFLAASSPQMLKECLSIFNGK